VHLKDINLHPDIYSPVTGLVEKLYLNW